MRTKFVIVFLERKIAKGKLAFIDQVINLPNSTKEEAKRALQEVKAKVGNNPDVSDMHLYKLVV